ncbi:MAG: 50S ribosomal protein L13 [Candidatus Omnitrophica bacterium]|nr:50S ribosomal protein L13 [Candidatus Omnitrophota bacterium]
MKSVMLKNTDVTRAWHLIDAKDKILGRVATQIASLLKGKHKCDITPHIDMGDGVVVINAASIKVTGNKMQEKRYKRYSGYPSGLKEEPMEHLLTRRPTEIIRHAVKGMLPKNKLGSRMLKRLKVYVEDKHPHQRQLKAETSQKSKGKKK